MWWSSTGHASKIERNERPTRTDRIRFILRNRKGDISLLGSQCAALATMCSELISRQNAVKHASQATLQAATAYLISVEAFLHQLLGSVLADE
jgi:hypothetical protein